MHILAIDTSNLPMSIAVVSEEKVLAEMTTNLHKNHSIRLMPALDLLLKEIGLTLKEIDLLAVASGPGSYTGVRIGVTAAKTIAWSLGKPLVGVSSLQVLAQQIPYFSGLLVPIFDARRGQVYTGVYRWEDNRLMEVLPERIILLKDLLNALKDFHLPALFLGDDTALHRSLIEEMMEDRAHFLPPSFNIPRASFIAQLGLMKYQAGQVEDISFSPRYLQKTEAETKLNQ